MALAHLTFNVMGVLLFYLVPRLRSIPIAPATRTAAIASEHGAPVAAHLLGVFIIAPVRVLALSR